MTRTALTLAAVLAASATQAAVFTANLTSEQFPDAWGTITVTTGHPRIEIVAEWETPFAVDAVFLQDDNSGYGWYDVTTSPAVWDIPDYWYASGNFSGLWASMVRMATGESLFGYFVGEYVEPPPVDSPPVEPPGDIPEPSTYAGLFALGLAGFAVYRRMKG